MQDRIDTQCNKLLRDLGNDATCDNALSGYVQAPENEKPCDSGDSTCYTCCSAAAGALSGDCGSSLTNAVCSSICNTVTLSGFKRKVSK